MSNPVAPVIKVVDDADLTSYDKCMRFMQSKGIGPMDFFPIASNVTLAAWWGDDWREREAAGEGPDAFAIVLYQTRIVMYYRDGRFSVANGGYNTPTTSCRITQFTPEGWHFGHYNKKLVGGRYGGQEEFGPLDHSVRLG